jgi:hypothetical protein
LVVTQPIGVSDDVGACFVHAEHHQQSLFFRKRITIQKIADQVAHQRQIACMAAEFDDLSLHPRHPGT